MDHEGSGKRKGKGEQEKVRNYSNVGTGYKRLFNSGGNYNNTTNAGVGYCNGNNNSRSNTNANIGFRLALPYRQKHAA